jgi:hypothetical protein
VGAEQLEDIRMNKDVEVSLLKASVRHLVADLKVYVQAQKETWQKVPWLALEADGRTGYSDGVVWREGKLRIPFGSECNYIAYIDLATGELMPFGDPRKLALLATALELVDAEQVVAELAERAAEPQRSYVPLQPGFRNVRAWREQMRKDYGIEER